MNTKAVQSAGLKLACVDGGIVSAKFEKRESRRQWQCCEDENYTFGANTARYAGWIKIDILSTTSNQISWLA